jgi:hypothetical protein
MLVLSMLLRCCSPEFELPSRSVFQGCPKRREVGNNICIPPRTYIRSCG